MPGPTGRPLPASQSTRRRENLVGLANPRARLDYVVLLEGVQDMAGFPDRVQVRIRYVPDRLIIASESFDGYLKVLGHDAFSSIEQIAACILDDINNQIVPRWVQVIAAGKKGALASGTHGVMFEDRQPNWDNPSLLDRIANF